MAIPPTGFEEADRAMTMGLCTREQAGEAKRIAMLRACNGDGFGYNDALDILREKNWITAEGIAAVHEAIKRSLQPPRPAATKDR